MANDQVRSKVTILLAEWYGGDDQARNRLVSVVYDELRSVAAASLRNESHGHTMQPTDLVNELYLRIFSPGSVNFVDRKHLFAIAARQMRRILVDHARSRNAQKRGRGLLVDLAGTVEPASKSQDLLVVDEALSKLAELDQRSAEVVELRFFASATDQETADALGISVNTVKRDWDFARACGSTKLSKRVDRLPSLAGGVVYECGGGDAFLYPTNNAGTSKASQAFWQVDNVEAEVAELKARGVVFEEYDMPGIHMVNGIATGGGAKRASGGRTNIA